MGSYTDKTFNPAEKVILFEVDTYEEMCEAEILLHELFQVDVNPHFANKAKQTSVGFSFRASGKNNPNFGRRHSDEARRKMSDAAKRRVQQSMSGKTLSKETKQKISEAHKGKTLSDESKQKISEAGKGRTHSDETKQKISEGKVGEKNPMYGKPVSDDHRQKISEANKGKLWFNNGRVAVRAETCPEGFIPGRIKKK
jgi:uncharacterized low-complexity protein